MIPESAGIYKIEHAVSGKVYVGSAINLQNRWAVHRHALVRGRHHSEKLQRAWNKYGAESFVFVIIELVDARDRLLSREQHWIDFLDAASGGFNAVQIAGSSLGRKFSEATLKKMSASQKGRKHTEEAKRKMSIARRGKPFSIEHRAKLAELNRARAGSVSDASRARQSAAAKVAQRGRRRDNYGRYAGAEHGVVWSDPMERAA